MVYKIIELTNDRLDDFIAYCKAHRHEVDDSYLYDQDLDEFQVGDINPSYLVIQENRIVGAVSLFKGTYQRSLKTGRMRIFHSVLKDQQVYQQMLTQILSHMDGLDRFNVFADKQMKAYNQMLLALSFDISRYALALANDQLSYQEVSYPEGYVLRNFKSGQDEGDWCYVRNAGFKVLKGSEAETTPAMYSTMENDYDHLEGGIMMVYHNDQPVGQIRVTDEERKSTYLSSLAVVPNEQGQGLGTKLLKSALNFSIEKGYKTSILTVNAENENAVELYKRLGFKVTDTMVCYEYRVK